MMDASSKMTVIFANSPGCSWGSGPTFTHDVAPMVVTPTTGRWGDRMSTMLMMRNSVVYSDSRR